MVIVPPPAQEDGSKVADALAKLVEIDFFLHTSSSSHAASSSTPKADPNNNTAAAKRSDLTALYCRQVAVSYALEKAIVARIDGLEQHEREVLKVASVAGYVTSALPPPYLSLFFYSASAII